MSGSYFAARGRPRRLADGVFGPIPAPTFVCEHVPDPDELSIDVIDAKMHVATCPTCCSVAEALEHAKLKRPTAERLSLVRSLASVRAI